MSMCCALFAIHDHELLDVLNRPRALEALLEGDRASCIASGDLDKAWHAVHFVLTGTASEGEGPLAFLLAGGRDSATDVGYGPARGFTADEVRRIHAAVGALVDDELLARIDPKRMDKLGVYPPIWDRDAAAENLGGFVLEGLRTVRQLLDTAVRESAAVIVILT